MKTNIYFRKGNKGDLIGKLDSGKVVLLRREKLSLAVQDGEAWECLIDERERFCLATPVARQEEKILFARQNDLFWQVKSGWNTLREERVLEYSFTHKSREFYITREVYAVVTGVEYKLCDRDMEELSGNENFQKVMMEKTAVEEAERAEAEVRRAREKAERLQANLAEAKKTFSAIAQALKEYGEFVFPGEVYLRVETLLEEQFVAVAFDGRKLMVNRKGGYRSTGFTYRDDSDDMEWCTSTITIKIGEDFEEKNLITLEGFEGFSFERAETYKNRLEAEKLAKAIAEAETAQTAGVKIVRYNVWQGRGRDSYQLRCLCGKNHSSFVYGVVDDKNEELSRKYMCDNCLTPTAKKLLGLVEKG